MRLRTISKRGLQLAFVIVVAKLAYDVLSRTTHDEVVERTYEHLRETAGPDATIEVDLPEGAVPGADGSPDRIGRHRPDLVLKGFDVPNAYVEVKVGEDLTPRAEMQLEAYRRGSYKRVLVVPEAVVPEAERFAERVEGTVHVTTPEGVEEVVADQAASESV